MQPLGRNLYRVFLPDNLNDFAAADAAAASVNSQNMTDVCMREGGVQ
jgi:hypothetical protein